MSQRRFPYVVAFAVASGIIFEGAGRTEQEDLMSFVTDLQDTDTLETWFKRAKMEVRKQQPALAASVAEFMRSNAAQEKVLTEQILANKSMLTFTSPEDK